MKANSTVPLAEPIQAVKSSALWAAYGDALGFVTEFADADRLQTRVHGGRLSAALSWKRHVGGRFGPLIELPAGCYSDDTQLRLATCRSIRHDGSFDVEAFAKVELPIWTCYALGAGRSSKAAASSLSHQDVRWFSNFYGKQRDVEYVQAGGNGAAMRIQPHVWASKDPSEPTSFLLDVVKNAICTHGHPRAILGSVFHAICLADALVNQRIPGPNTWRDAHGWFARVASSIREDSELSMIWLPVWKERSAFAWNKHSKQLNVNAGKI